jgi:organic hydroperoxide reductase OsmC/OhrA
MQNFPHVYTVAATGTIDDDVDVSADGLPTLRSASPAEFGGPGNRWSPETLLVGAVADCFILTFRAVARASKLPWTSLRCDVRGTLDRPDRVMQFTGFDIRAHLEVPPGTDPGIARRVLDKAENACLVSQSLKGVTHLAADVSVDAEPLRPTA